MSAERGGKAQLEQLLKLCKEKELLEYPEVRKARTVYRQELEEHYAPVIRILETLLSVQNQVDQLIEWFDDKKVEVLKEGLDSDDIAEAFHLSELYISKPRSYTVDFLNAVENLTKVKVGLITAIEQRRELLANTKAATDSLARLENETTAHSNELQFLRNRLERFQSQVHHGYTPELEILREITEKLESMATAPNPADKPSLDPLQEAVNAFLNRYESKLSLAESRELRERLDGVLKAADPVGRWSCWSRLRSIEEKYSTKWDVPRMSKRKKRKARSDTELFWDILNKMNDAEPELWETLAQSFKKSAKKQMKDLDQLKKELSINQE